MPAQPLYGAIEAGGTKFICAVAHGTGELLAETRITTTTPQQTIGAALDFFAQQAQQHGALSGMGIASFGPVDLNPASGSYGHILGTPKPLWSHTDLLTPFRQRFGCPVAIDTDVNAAALAEIRLGAGRGCNTLVYVTVGTGIGGGFFSAGQTHKGRLHPEMGHIRVLRHAQDRDFAGVCPFHGDCLEGLASGPAIHARFGCTLDMLPPTHLAWDIIADYLGQLASTLILLLSPERVVFGGGVPQNIGLLPLIRHRAATLLNGYAGLGYSGAALASLIVAPELGTASGITGALLLAQQAVRPD